MGFKIESNSCYRPQVYYRLCFEDYRIPGDVRRFRCDREGVVYESDLQPATRKRLDYCRDSVYWSKPWIEEVTRQFFHPGHGTCDCGTLVYLDSPLTTCACGARYDLYGGVIDDVVNRISGSESQFKCNRCEKVWTAEGLPSDCPRCYGDDFTQISGN